MKFNKWLRSKLSRKKERKLGTLLACSTLFLSMGGIVAQALSLPSGATQVGNINNAPIVKSATNNTSSQHFKDIVSS